MTKRYCHHWPGPCRNVASVDGARLRRCELIATFATNFEKKRNLNEYEFWALQWQARQRQRLKVTLAIHHQRFPHGFKRTRMSSAYIRSLQRSLDAEAEPQKLFKPDLKPRFIEWFASVPEISRNRPYSMVELERALGTQGRFLSPVLLNLGWERRRKWSSNGQSPRYWLPPASNLESDS